MSCEIPTALEVRELLEGYCLDDRAETAFTANTTAGSVTLVNISSFTNVKRNVEIVGPGIPGGSRVLSFDSGAGTITMSKAATADATSVSLVVVSYASISDDWIIRRRDRFVVPWVEKVTGLSLAGTQQHEEYLSGNGREILVLSRKPVASLDSLEYVTYADDDTTSLAESVELVPDEGILISRAGVIETQDPAIFPKGRYNIKVKYTVGYAADEVPCDLAEAISMMVASQVLVSIGARTGGGSLTVRDHGRQYGARGKYTDAINQLDKDAYAILTNYFSHVVGA